MRLSAFMLSEIPDKKRCPKCNTQLKSKKESYLVDVGRKSLEIGCDGGLFCPNCPTVVLDERVFKKMISLMVVGRSPRYTVRGMVAMDSVPKDKTNVPLGERDNPMPLVKFDYPATEPQDPKKAKSQKKSRSRLLRIVGQKPKTIEVGRNDPCPCGSGKKYKKCCMSKSSRGKPGRWLGRITGR